MITLLVYETLQKAAARRKEPGAPAKASPLENMVIGAIAGGIGSLATNPMDMIKTRMMTAPELYAGPMDAAWVALSKEGPQVRRRLLPSSFVFLVVDLSLIVLLLWYRGRWTLLMQKYRTTVVVGKASL